MDNMDRSVDTGEMCRVMNKPPEKKRRVQELPNECPNDTSDSVTAPVMQSSSAKLPAVKVEERCFQLVPASPSLCELNETFSDSFHSPAEKGQKYLTLSTLPTLTPLTSSTRSITEILSPPTITPLTLSTSSTTEKHVTPPTLSTPPTLKPLIKSLAAPKSSRLAPPRRLISQTVKRSLDFGNTDRKLNEEWLTKITESRCPQQDMNCPPYKQPSLSLSSLLGLNTVILPDHPNQTTTMSSEGRRPNSIQYMSVMRCVPREQ